MSRDKTESRLVQIRLELSRYLQANGHTSNGKYPRPRRVPGVNGVYRNSDLMLQANGKITRFFQVSYCTEWLLLETFKSYVNGEVKFDPAYKTEFREGESYSAALDRTIRKMIMEDKIRR